MAVRVPRLIQVFNVQCVMCGRAAGQLMNGTFVPNQRVRTPVPGKNGSRCGECGGNLYLEPDESVTPFMATAITLRDINHSLAGPAHGAMHGKGLSQIRVAWEAGSTRAWEAGPTRELGGERGWQS